MLRYLVMGDVLRGGVYPLCVGPERVVQARALADAAREVGASTVAHGSTGAGNDQIRFDTALRLLADDLDVLTPIRTLALSRDASADFLRQRGVEVSAATTGYSVNRGLWGTTIGGPRDARDGRRPARVGLAGHRLAPRRPPTSPAP